SGGTEAPGRVGHELDQSRRATLVTSPRVAAALQADHVHDRARVEPIDAGLGIDEVLELAHLRGILGGSRLAADTAARLTARGARRLGLLPDALGRHGAPVVAHAAPSVLVRLRVVLELQEPVTERLERTHVLGLRLR